MLQDIIIVLEECNLLQYYIWCGEFKSLIGVKYYNWEGNYTVLALISNKYCRIMLIVKFMIIIWQYLPCSDVFNGHEYIDGFSRLQNISTMPGSYYHYNYLKHETVH